LARRSRRPLGPLDLRSQAILRAVIEEYVTTAQPVGSQALVERYGLGVSSATVRSILAELEAAGLLTHPHTSAGRVPTDAGYRLYVESIADGVALAPVEQLMIRHQFGQVAFVSDQWFRLAASTLAGATRAAGFATPAKPQACRVKRVDLVGNGSRTASLLLILAEGPVKQTLISLDEPRSQEQLNGLAATLDRAVRGMDAAGVESRLESLDERLGHPAVLRQTAERIVRLMREFDAASVEDVFSEGLLNVMEAPEFSQSEQVSRVFRVLQDRRYLG